MRPRPPIVIRSWAGPSKRDIVSTFFHAAYRIHETRANKSSSVEQNENPAFIYFFSLIKPRTKERFPGETSSLTKTNAIARVQDSGAEYLGNARIQVFHEWVNITEREFRRRSFLDRKSVV